MIKLMNAYRNWIVPGWRVFLSSQLLSILVLATLWLGFWGVVNHWPWAPFAIAALLLLDLFLGVAQMTNWRWDGP